MSTPKRVDLDEARSMWLAGYRYCAIAKHFGVSKQAVEQLRDNYPEFFPVRDWMTPSKAGRIAQVEYGTISRWITNGLLVTSPDGLVRMADVEAVISYLWTRQCEYPSCDHDVESVRLDGRFCPEHIFEVQRYYYPFASSESKQRHHEANERWAAKNPERHREIRQRAVRAYRARQREKKARTNA